jgi:hypothetical protein
MLYAITGKPGSGKSYYLAHLYTELVKKDPEALIFSNVPMSYGEHKTVYFYDLSDLLTAFYHPRLANIPRIILLDEAYYLLDAKNWKQLAPEMTIALRQHRKLLVDMYVVAQDWGNLNIDFRRLVNNVYYARKSLQWFTFFPNKVINFINTKFQKNYETWFFTRYEYYKEVSETQTIPFVKNDKMNMAFREGRFIAENPNAVQPDDTFMIGQKGEVRAVYDTMLQVAKPDPVRLQAIFDTSPLYKKIDCMVE